MTISELAIKRPTLIIVIFLALGLMGIFGYFQPTQAGVVAAPMSYEIDGEQYVAVLAGWGGALPLVSGGLTANTGANPRRLLVYKLGGKTALPAPPVVTVQRPTPPPAAEDEATLARGKRLYQANCNTCQADSAVGNNVLPDLRFSPMLQFGHTSLFIYWIHVDMAYGLLSWPLHRGLPLAWSLTAFPVFTVLMLWASVAKDRGVAKWRARRAAVTAAP